MRHGVPQWSFNDAFSEEDMRDFDARDDDYETRVAAKVWATVKALREKRTDFRELILKDIEDKKKTEPET